VHEHPYIVKGNDLPLAPGMCNLLKCSSSWRILYSWKSLKQDFQLYKIRQSVLVVICCWTAIVSCYFLKLNQQRNLF